MKTVAGGYDLGESKLDFLQYMSLVDRIGTVHVVITEIKSLFSGSRLTV